MTCKIDYTANGSTVVFPFPFAIPARTALEVRVDDSVREVGYHISGAGCDDGGMVVFDSPPASGAVVSLRYLGGVTVGVNDAAAGHLGEKLVAGANITLEAVVEDGGVQRLRIAGTQVADGLEKAANLADLADNATARANLGVYSKAEVEALDQAVRDAALLKTGNLGGLTDKAAARANLEVYSTTQVDGAIAASSSSLADAMLRKDQNLADLPSKAAARANLGLDQAAYLNVAQDWTKPQRSQATQAASVGGAVVLDFALFQNFDLSLTAEASFANPTLAAALVGQKGTIGISPNGHGVTAMGSMWKRVGDVGAPGPIVGMGRIDYHIRALDRIEYAYNDVEV